MRRRTRVVWKNRTKEIDNKPHIEDKEEEENVEFRSYFVSYVDGEAIYNIKYGDSIRQIPPITETLDSIISISKGYSVGQSSSVDNEQPQLEPHILHNQLQNSKQFFELSRSNNKYIKKKLKEENSTTKATTNDDKDFFYKSVNVLSSQIEDTENYSPFESELHDFYIISSTDDNYIKSQIEAHENFTTRNSVKDGPVDESIALYNRLKELNLFEGTIDNPSHGSRLIVQRMIEVRRIVKIAKSYKHMDKQLWDLPKYLNFQSNNNKRVYKFSSSMGVREPLYIPLVDGGYTMSGNERIADPVVAQPDENALRSNLLDIETNPYLHSILPPQVSKRNQLTDLINNGSKKEEIIQFVKAFGVAKEHRAFIWQLLSNCISNDPNRRNEELEKKRREYYSLIENLLDLTKMSDYSIADFNIILLDTPRTSPSGFENIFRLPCVRQSLERVLLLWSLVNPSGYFQGLNDIAATIYTVFLDSCLGHFGDIDEVFSDPNSDIIKYIEEALLCCESDVYYCLTFITSSIEKIHPFKRGGLYVESMVEMIEALIQKHDYKLWSSITKVNIPFIQFLFRWLLCLFIREMSLQSVVCLWDSYFIEDNGFPIFHMYVTAAFLFHFSQDLINKDYEEMILFLFHMPTGYYTKHDVHNIVQSAYELQLIYPYPFTE